MRNQCYVECSIRSWTGLDDKGKKKGCSVTMTEDEEERREGYKQLKEKALKREVKEEYIKMRSPESPRQEVFDKNDKKRAMEMLGISEEDMDKEWQRQMREIHEKNKKKED